MPSYPACSEGDGFPGWYILGKKKKLNCEDKVLQDNLQPDVSQKTLLET